MIYYGSNGSDGFIYGVLGARGDDGDGIRVSSSVHLDKIRMYGLFDDISCICLLFCIAYVLRGANLLRLKLTISICPRKRLYEVMKMLLALLRGVVVCYMHPATAYE